MIQGILPRGAFFSGRNFVLPIWNSLPVYVRISPYLCQRNQETAREFQGSEVKKPPRKQQKVEIFKNKNNEKEKYII